MGSKAPIVPRRSEDSPAEESHLGRSDFPNASAKNQLLERIADALQVAPAALYNPPNAVTPTRKADSENASDGDLDQDCKALLGAYRGISDPDERRGILAFVQAAAERS